MPPFTDKSLKALRVPAGRVDLADPLTPGLHFRKSASGHASFSVVYRVRGRQKQERLTLGTHPRMTVAEAREEAEATLKAAAKGIDPRRTREAPEVLLFADLFREYMERHAVPKLASAYAIRQKIGLDVLPILGKRPVLEITRRDIIAISDRIVARGAVATARHVLAMLSAVFTWAMGRDLCEYNPVYRVERPGRPQAGTRVLDDGEVRQLLLHLIEAARSSGRHRGGLTACVLLSRLLLGQRTTETLAMNRRHFEGEEWWNLPPSITKMTRPHRVYLIPLWRELVAERLAVLAPGPLCFEGKVRGQPLDESAVTAYVGRICRGLGFHFAARDLRRTYITGLAKLGVSRDTRRRLVNHKIPGVDQTHYDLYDYDPEKKQAALIWDAHLRRLLDGESAAVLPFRA